MTNSLPTGHRIHVKTSFQIYEKRTLSKGVTCVGIKIQDAVKSSLSKDSSPNIGLSNNTCKNQFYHTRRAI
jgi:hypothetical protein